MMITNPSSSGTVDIVATDFNPLISDRAPLTVFTTYIYDRLRPFATQIVLPFRFGADGLKSIATKWTELWLSSAA